MKVKKNLYITMVLLALVPAILVTAALAIIYTVENSRKAYDKIESVSNLQFDTVRRFYSDLSNNIEMMCTLISPQQILEIAAGEEPSLPSEPTDDQKADYASKISNNKHLFSTGRNVLSTWAENHKEFNRVSLVDRNNNVIISSHSELEGKPSSIDQRYLRRLSQNETVVTNLFRDEYAENTYAFIVAKPIFVNDMYAGFMLLSTKPDSVQQLLGKTQVFNTGVVDVLDITNNIIATNRKDVKVGESELQDISQVLALHIEPTDMFAYNQGGKTRIMSYMRMYDTGWIVVYSVAQNEFAPNTFYAILYISIITIVVAGLGVLVSIIIRKRFTSPLFKLLTSLHQMKGGDYSNRVPYLGKNEFSEIGSAFNNLMTKIELDNKELLIKEERYRIANEQSNSVIFEANVETQGFTCSANACEFANYPAFMHNFPESLSEMQVLHSEDAAQFMRLFSAMSRGRRTGSMEVRMRTYKDEYHWFSLLLTTITDTATFKPLRIIGKLTDIDEEKKMTANLTFKAERDPLTSVYNKSTTQSMITQRLSDRKQDLYYALIVLDIDDFKHVNDGYGHQKGDAVLMDLASALLSQLRSEDIVGRIGGDEFMVLLSAMPSREAVATKANKLLTAIRNIPLDEETGVYLTSSMGIALCPQDGTGFNQLYASADNALYVRKNAGKDGFLFYREAGAE